MTFVQEILLIKAHSLREAKDNTTRVLNALYLVPMWKISLCLPSTMPIRNLIGLIGFPFRRPFYTWGLVTICAAG